MREDLLNEVFQDLQAQQIRNEETEAARRREIRQGYPAIAAMMERREELIREGMRAVLRGEMAAEDLPRKMEEISRGIREGLAAENYPADYLSPVYTCPLCRDTGYVGDRVREKCGCVRKRYQAKLRQAIGLAENSRETFEHFDPGVFPDRKAAGEALSQRETMVRIRRACESWADAFPDSVPKNLVLSGKSGLGKTFLLHAMANRLIERDRNVLLLSAHRFLEIARRSYYENDGQLEDLISTEALMLDDLGSEPMMQNVTVEQLFNLINERQRRNPVLEPDARTFLRE